MNSNQPTTDAPVAHELDETALEFHNASKMARSMQQNMSKNSLIRVLNAVREYPLHGTTLKNDLEKQVLNLTLGAILAKNKMVQYVMADRQKLLQDAENAMKEGDTNEQSVETSGTSSSGQEGQ